MANNENRNHDRLSALETKVGKLQGKVDSNFAGLGIRLNGIEKQLADLVKSGKTNWGVLVTAVGVVMVIGAAVLTPIYATMLYQRENMNSFGERSHALEVSIVDRMAKAEGSILNLATHFEGVHGEIDTLNTALKEMEERQVRIRAEMDIKIQGEIVSADLRIQEEIDAVEAKIPVVQSMLEGRIDRELQMRSDDAMRDHRREEELIGLTASLVERVRSLERHAGWGVQQATP